MDLVGVVGCDRVEVGDFVQFDVRVVLLNLGDVQWRWQELTNALLAVGCQGVGEFDGQDQEHVPVHEGVLVGRHALALYCLHHSVALLSIRVGEDVHGAAFSGLFGRQGLLARALFEVGAALIHDENADVDALALQLSLACFLEGVNVGGVGLRDVVDARAVAVLHDLPICLAVFGREGVKPLGHGLDDLTRLCFDEELSSVEVVDL
mmetsp:Transcript_22772/g.50112  ORF Transcript_22772/g.50112 Transcript_22772/m.50112 type:complete len:207 (-) Transcript_22772:580-1200(-)